MTPWRPYEYPLPCAPTPGARIRSRRRVRLWAKSSRTWEPRFPRSASDSSTAKELRRFVNVYLNNEDIRYLDDLATPVAENDEVSIIPAVAGG